MSIHEYRCTSCGEITERRQKEHTASDTCKECNNVANYIPSVPGYRRDHTMVS